MNRFLAIRVDRAVSAILEIAFGASLVLFALVPLAYLCADHHDTDPRPVIEVASLKNGCPPCTAFEKWVEENGDKCKYRFSITKYERYELPDWATSTPMFRFSTAKGSKMSFAGWQGEAYLDQWYTFHNPPRVQTKRIEPEEKPGLPAVDQLQKFLTKDGTFEFSPGSPVKVVMDDGTTVSYTRIKAVYEIDNGVMTIKLQDQLPKFRISRWGFGINGEVRGADYPSKPGAVDLDTNYGKFTVKLEQVP